jgi:serine/threonine protein phosphatase PrpC
MGGHQAGEVASLTAVDVACRAYQAGNGSPGRCLSNALIAANRAVHELASGDERLADMGTTCTALALCGGFAYLAHVGDSRVYLIRNGDIYQMTEDHTLVMELVRKGMITAKEAREHPERMFSSAPWAAMRPLRFPASSKALHCDTAIFTCFARMVCVEFFPMTSFGRPRWQTILLLPARS